jgi:hypothetical protein
MAERRGAHKDVGRRPQAARRVGWALCLAIAVGVIAAVIRVSM